MSATFKQIPIAEAGKKFKTILPTINQCKEYGIHLVCHVARYSKHGHVIQHLFWVKSDKDAVAELWTHEEVKGLLYQYKLAISKQNDQAD
jgi:hypothetical protein